MPGEKSVATEPLCFQAVVQRVEAPPVVITPGNCCPTYGKTERQARAFLTALVGKDAVVQVTGAAWGVLASDVVAALERRKAAGANGAVAPRDEDEAAAVQAGLRVVGGRR